MSEITIGITTGITTNITTGGITGGTSGSSDTPEKHLPDSVEGTVLLMYGRYLNAILFIIKNTRD